MRIVQALIAGEYKMRVSRLTITDLYHLIAGAKTRDAQNAQSDLSNNLE